MTGSARSLFGRVLFASKGEASPAPQMPSAPRLPMPALAPRSVDGAAPAPARRESSPLSFLITRRPPVAAAGRPVAAIVAPTGPALPPHLGEAAPLTALLARQANGRRCRRSLTLRLELGDYLRFRECAAHREATFQSLLEAMVLRFLTAPPAQTDEEA